MEPRLTPLDHWVSFAIGLVVVSVPLLVWWQDKRRDWKRGKQWRAFASSVGLRYQAGDPFGMIGSWPHPFLSPRDSPRVVHLVFGVYRRREVLCFDLRGARKGSAGSGVDFTAVAVAPPMRMEPILVHPESFADHLATKAGREEIEFESEEFSRCFEVTCEDRRFAYDLLHQRAMDHLLSMGSVVVEGDEPAVLFHLPYAYCLPIPDGVRELLDQACRLMEMVPDYMRKDRPRAAVAR